MATEPGTDALEEVEDQANRRRMLAITAFVGLFAAANLAVYLWLRPPNRHLEPTPYEAVIRQLRSNMSEQDVLALFRAARDGVPRADIRTFDESTPSGTRHVLSYQVGVEEPLQVHVGPGNTVAEWCYQDHCHDNLD